MAVHAHPDDEVVFTGGTLLLYRNRGANTVLVTATGGEEGEIHDPDLDPEEARPRVGFEKAGDAAYHPELGEPWQPLKLYYTHWPQEVWERARQLYIERGLKWPWEEEERQADEDPEHQSTEEGLAERQEEIEEAR